jgi:putative CRISPR-associated protein (TIGR02619 family)
MNQLHIITVGTSLITNYARYKGENFAPPSDEKFWSEKLKDEDFKNKVLEFLRENPTRHSAELNAFLNFLKKKGYSNFKDIGFYLIETATSAGELCGEIIRKYLKEQGFRDLGAPKEIYGYFRQLAEEESREEKFLQGLKELLNTVLELIKKQASKGVKIYLNPTGGFKAHVIMLGIASALTGVPAYYINEYFNEVIELPPLMWKFSKDEYKLLELLYKNKRISRTDSYFNIFIENRNLIENFERFTLIEVKKDEKGEIIEIKITPLGKTIVETIIS